MATNIDFAFAIPQATAYTIDRWSGYASGITIAVILGGTAIPLTLTNSQGFTSTTTTVTSQNAGVYLISYRISTTASLLMQAGVFINGTSATPLVSDPGVAATQFEGCSIQQLNAGDNIQLQLYGLLGSAVLIGGAGATLNIVRIA